MQNERQRLLALQKEVKTLELAINQRMEIEDRVLENKMAQKKSEADYERRCHEAEFREKFEKEFKPEYEAKIKEATDKAIADKYSVIDPDDIDHEEDKVLTEQKKALEKLNEEAKKVADKIEEDSKPVEEILSAKEKIVGKKKAAKKKS